MKRILVAVDGSETALRAVDLAANIAGPRDISLVIATVVENCGIRGESLEVFGYSEHMVGPVSELLRRAAERTLDIARERAMRAGVKATQLELRSGKAVEEILELAVQCKVDLLVLGCCGRNAGGEKDVLGGTAFKLVNLAPCNIAIAR